jgi:Asp-tRNA(Asn)/Glu-tRNA(Gln) amidotransferase A subunit family amidase
VEDRRARRGSAADVSDGRIHRQRQPHRLPAISVPCGFTPDRLPVGFQLVGKAFEEPTLLQIARGYERATTWADEAPELLVSSSN